MSYYYTYCTYCSLHAQKTKILQLMTRLITN